MKKSYSHFLLPLVFLSLSINGFSEESNVKLLYMESEENVKNNSSSQEEIFMKTASSGKQNSSKAQKGKKEACQSPGYKLCEHSNGVLPSARGCCGTQGPYFVGSFIYWKAAFENFVPASLIHEAEPIGDRNIIQPKTIKFTYDPGLKLGMGYNLPGDGWDLFIDWTWLRSHPHLTVNANDIDDVFVPELTHSFVGLQSKSHGHILVNTGDLELGRSFFVGNYVSVRPFGGAKALWLNYSIKTNYFNFLEDGIDPVTDFQSTSKDDIWGIGPRFGIDTRWLLGTYHFAFVMNGAISLVWENSHYNTSITSIKDEGPHGGILKSHVKKIQPIGELFAGFDYEYCFDKWAYLNLSVGYEVQFWNNQIPSTFLTSPAQSFSMQGLTASVRLDF